MKRMFDMGYRFRFYPTKEQADLLNRTFGCVRVVYNTARAEREKAWVERKESFGFIKTNALLTAIKKKEDFAWLNEVSCVPLQQCLRHLDTAYRNFFRKTARYPRFRKKNERQSAEFTKSGFHYKNGTLKLAKMDKNLNIVWSRELPSRPSTVTVIREADGKWFVVCRVMKAVKGLVGGGSIGIDLGIKDFAVLSTGEKIRNHKHLSKRAKKLAHLQRIASKKMKGSNNRRKANVKVSRAYSLVRNARKDFLHKLSTKLIRENQTICVESLNVNGMVKNRRLSKAICDCGWTEFVTMLKYKALWYGRNLVKIDRWFPSTKSCSECGTTGHNLSLSIRGWTCPDCGTDHDRDVNAAKNILAAGMAVLACGEDCKTYLASAA